MAENYTLSTTLIANTQAYINNMKQAEQATRGMEQSAQKTEGSTSKFGKTIATSMAVGGAAVTAIGVKSLKSFGDFEQGLNTAAIIAGGTSEDIEGLSAVALKMGQDLPLSAQDSADAMIEMARNGASIDELKKVFPAIAMASTAAGADLQTTAGVVQQAMNVWGDSLESPEQAAAYLTQTANLSNASIESMQQALATLGPTAVASGMSLSDTSTAVGLLTNTGTSSAQAAQELRHAILQMQAPSKKAAEAMDELGITYRNADGTMKPFTQIAKEVSKALDGVGTANRDAYLKTLFHTSGMQAMRTIMKAVNDESGDAKTSWSAYSKEMEKVGKNTETANKYLNQQAFDMQNNTGASLEQVGGAWDSFSMNAMNASKKTNRAVLGMAADMISWAASSDDSLAKAARGFVGFSPYIGVAMTSMSTFITQTKNITGAVASMTKGLFKGVGAIGRFTMKLLPFGKGAGDAASKTEKMSSSTAKAGTSASGASPKLMGIAKATMQIGVGVGAATAGIGIMASGISLLAKTGTDGVIAVAALSAGIIAVTAVLALFGPALTASSAGLTALAAVMISFGAGVGLATAGIGAMSAGIALLVTAFIQLTTVADKIVPTMNAIGTGGAIMIGQFVTTLYGYVPQVISLFSSMMTGALQTIITNAPLMAQAFIAVITSMVTVLTTNIPMIVGKFTEMFVAILQGMAQNAPKLIKAWTDLIVNILTGLAENMPRFSESAAKLVISFLKGMAAYIPEITAAWTRTIVAVLTGLSNNMGSFIDAGIKLVVSFLNGMANRIGEVVKAGINLVVKVLEGVGNNIGDLITAGIDLIGKFLLGIANALPDVYEQGKQVVLSVIEGIGYILGDLVTSGGEALDRFVQGFKNGFGKARSGGEGAGNQTKSGLQSVSLFSVGSFLMDGLSGGLASKTYSLFSQAASIANGIKNRISRALHIGSPSKDMIQIGKWTTEGLAIGLEREKKLVSRASDDLAQLAAIEPIQYSSNIATPKGVNMKSTNDINISLDDRGVQPAHINLSLGGRAFSAFAQDISTELGSQARLSAGNSVY